MFTPLCYMTGCPNFVQIFLERSVRPPTLIHNCFDSDMSPTPKSEEMSILHRDGVYTNRQNIDIVV